MSYVQVLSVIIGLCCLSGMQIAHRGTVVSIPCVAKNTEMESIPRCILQNLQKIIEELSITGEKRQNLHSEELKMDMKRKIVQN